MFCSNCGAKLAEDSLFCHKCGARVILSVEMPSAGEADTTPAPDTEEMIVPVTDGTLSDTASADTGDDAGVIIPADEEGPALPENATSPEESDTAAAVTAEDDASNTADAAEEAEFPEEAPADEAADTADTQETEDGVISSEIPEDEASGTYEESQAEESDETPSGEGQDVSADETEVSAAPTEEAEETDPHGSLTSHAEEADAAAADEDEKAVPEDAESPDDTEAPSEVSAEAEPAAAPVIPSSAPARSRRPGGAADAAPVTDNSAKPAAAAAPQKPSAGGKKIKLNSPIVKILAAILGVALVFGTLYYIVFDKIRSQIPAPDDTDNVPADTSPEPAPGPASQDLELGKKALEDKNYITALTYLEKAYGADPSSVEAEDLLRRALSELQKRSAGEGDFSGNEKYLLRMQELWQDQDQKLAAMYNDWLRYCANDPDRSKGQDVLARAKEYIDRSDTILYTYLFREPFDAEEFANRIAVFYGSDEPSFISMAVHYNRDFIASTLNELKMDELCINTEECEYPYVILRRQKSTGGYSIYYGELDDSGRRGGVGSFYTYIEDPVNPVIHYFTSRWTDNAPNGQFTEVIMSGDKFSDTETYKGTVKNGFYQGTITMTRDGTAYEGSYDNGKVIPIRRSEDGRTVVAEATDGSGLCLYASVDNDTARYGLEDWS